MIISYLSQMLCYRASNRHNDTHAFFRMLLADPLNSRNKIAIARYKEGTIVDICMCETKKMNGNIYICAFLFALLKYLFALCAIHIFFFKRSIDSLDSGMLQSSNIPCVPCHFLGGPICKRGEVIRST